MLFKYLLLTIPFLFQEPQVIGIYGDESENHPMGGVGSDGVYYRKYELKLYDNNTFEFLEQHAGLYNTPPRFLKTDYGTYRIEDSTLVLKATEYIQHAPLWKNEDTTTRKSYQYNNFSRYKITRFEMCDRQCLSRWKGKFPLKLLEP